MNAKGPIGNTLDCIYEQLDGSEIMEAYGERHGINSAAILTVTDDEMAGELAAHLADRVRGKTVVEIGGGISLLACHLAEYAERVYVIEANPAWTSVFLAFLFYKKPKNLSFLFGAAEEFEGIVRGDVALFCTHSDHKGMRAVASRFAQEVIDVYEEIVGDKHTELMKALKTLRVET